MQSLMERKLRLCISDIDVYDIARFSFPLFLKKEEKKKKRKKKLNNYINGVFTC